MRVFIQNEAGSFVKHLHDEKTLALKSEARVSRAYPFPYGFVLNTTAEDRDNVDCFVLTREKLHTGQIVECEAVGLMEQIEDDEIDHNVLATLPGENLDVNSDTQQVLIEFVTHVFDHIPNKKIQVGTFRGSKAADEYLSRYRD